MKQSFVKLLIALIALSINVQLIAQTTDPITRDVDVLLDTQDPIWVHLDRAVLRFEIRPVIVNGRTFVELNSLFTAMDITSTWEGSERKVTAFTSNGTKIELYIGRRDAYINGSRRWLDASPFIATPYNRTMMPLSFVAEATGANVSWLGKPRTVDIKTGAGRHHAIVSAHDMAEFMWRGYYAFGEDGPISVVNGTLIQDGIQRSVYMIGLSGTDLPNVNHNGNATGILEDLIVGGWNGNNAFKTAVKNVLDAQVPKNASLILAGHSLGGMVAQQVSSDSWVKSNYNVLHTVTLGSPLISAGSREGEVRRLGDWNDVVPLLSVEGTILAPWQIAGLNTEDGDFGLLGVLPAHTVSYRLGRVWAAYDAVGRKWGDSVISYNSGNIRYYAAPR